MSDLDRFQSMMLDHLFGLLEPEQVAELEAYLATAPEAAALRQRSEDWKRQLSLAAKTEFPELKFTAEMASGAHAPKLPVRPQPVRPVPAVRKSSSGRGAAHASGRQSRWAPWAIGAAVLAVTLVFGIPLMRNASAQIEEARQVHIRQEEYEKADKEFNSVVGSFNVRFEVAQREERLAAAEDEELRNRFNVDVQEAQKAINDKQYIVRLSGPARAQPGAPNEWRVEMYRRNGGTMSLPGRVEWQVKDQDGEVVFSDARQPIGQEGFREPPTVNLPISFWEKVKSDNDLTLEVVAYEGNLKSKVNARVPLARPVYVTHLATDKPLYKPGQHVYFRSLTLDRATFCPPEKDMTLEFRITKPGGQPETIAIDGQALRGSARLMDGAFKEIVGPDKKPLRGIACGAYELPEDAPGGEYELSVVDVTASVDELHHQVVAKNAVLETRKFNVIKYQQENILKTLEFDGKSYGPGDVVSVKCTGTPIQGGKKKLGLRVVARVDGKTIPVSHPNFTDAEGVARLKFTLPKNITQGVGTFDVTLQDGGDSEVISRPIPLVGRILHVEFFPEGGDLVANVPNRVYFQVQTPNGKPADLKGQITDGEQIVAEAATLTDADQPGVNRGQGVFTIVPQPGKTYFLKVQKPSGIIASPVVSATALARGIGISNNAVGIGSLATSIQTGFELPKVKADGVVLTALEPVTNPEQPIRISLSTPKKRKTLVVGAYARGNLVDHERIQIEPGISAELQLKPSNHVGGVTRVTVFEETMAGEGKSAVLVPVAERLVYHKPAQYLSLSAQPNLSLQRKGFNPGSKVELDIQAENESKHSVPAVVMVAVVNQNVLTMADEKTARLMPTHFLLASEVKKPGDLEHADFLLGEDPKAAVALDLLLGTQGWRRFAEQSTVPAKSKSMEDVERLLVANGQAQAPVDTLRQEVEKVYAEYLPKLETAAARLAEAKQAQALVENEFVNVRGESIRLADQRAAAHSRYRESLARLRQYEEDGTESRSLYLARLCIGLLVISGCCFVVGAIQHGTSRIGYFAAAAACFSLCAIALLGSSLATPSGDVRKEMVFRGSKLVVPDGFAEEDAAVAGLKTDEAPAADFEPAADERFDFNRNQNKPAPGAMVMPARAKKELKLAAALPMAAAPEGRGGGVGGAGKGANGVRPAFGMANDRLQKNANQLQEFEKAKQAEALKADGKAIDGVFFRKRLSVRDLGRQVEQQRALGRAERFAGLRNREAAGQPMLGALAPQADKDARFDELEIEFEVLQANQTPGFFVREYKFQKPVTENAERNDFTETVCWQPVLVLPESGRTNVQFQLSDSIARYQVLVAGHTLDGRLGASVTHIEARKPFTVDPKVPFEVTANDRIDVPIRIVNDSDVHRAVSLSIAPNGLTTWDPATKFDHGTFRMELMANQKGRQVLSFRPTKKEGEASLAVVGTSDPVEAPDQILRTFRVVPDGFPVSGAASDLLEKQASATITLPELVKGTLKVQLNVYPTTLADLQKGLEGLMREPGGCFEQTSTSNYPNLLVLDYLKSCDQAKPELVQRAKDMLDRGYAKLVAFECPDSGANNVRRGFEWFGQMDQQHQALTAYGLLQFKDLAAAYPGKVDPELIKRTQQYLLGQQKPANDGFKRNERALDTFGRAPDHITDAYIVWALTESDPDDKEGMTDLLKQLDSLKKQAKENPQAKNDPYFLALVANALLHRPGNGNREAALGILEQIAQNNLKNGVVEGAQTSITCSGGRDLQIETTALAVLGWLRSGEPTKFIKPVKESTKWIGQQRGGHGGFGSTQSTILALKALIEHTKASRKPAEAGEIRMVINGKTFTKTFTKDDLEVITLDIDKPEDIFKPGMNEARLELTTKQPYPFSLAWSGTTTTPLSSEKRAVELNTTLDRAHAIEGEIVRVNVSLANKVETGHGMAIAIVGLPGGCRLPADLKEMTKLREDGKISFFEIRGRELVLYWRSLKPSEQIQLSFGMVCDIPGKYAGPASRGYLYYNADHKHWVNPLSIEIAPANQNGDEEVANR